jgi:putative phosphoesterase
MPDRVVGILSDSHGQRLRVRAALALLAARGADLFIHLGDVGESVLDELAGHDCHLVFGNCDDARSLAGYAIDLGLRVHHPAGVLEIDGKRVGFTHGHLPDELERLHSARVDYLLHGHTHQRSDCVVETVRVINPGALHRAHPHTVAILVPATGLLENVVV